MSQRQPRVEDPAYLAYVRTLPCLICGRPGSDPAHIRSPSLAHGKPLTGLQRKPDDKWVLPLCRAHHDEQHRHNEVAWWASYGIDPFATAQALMSGSLLGIRLEQRSSVSPLLAKSGVVSRGKNLPPTSAAPSPEPLTSSATPSMRSRRKGAGSDHGRRPLR